MESLIEGNFETLVAQSRARTMEATLGVLGVNDPGLRQHLTQLMSAAPGQETSFFAPPLFEHTFGWKTADRSLRDLTGSLLHQRVFDALTEADNDEYRFEKDMVPYRHQIVSWETLLAKDPRSLVVTTGTGSGKTECFMVPILQDLVSTLEETKQPLTGVRALFLYPLNALINSQRERLKAWIEPFGSDIRFCLYNGETEERESKVRSSQRENPSEVLSRERLRREPPPILMTNATMLEYMLVRQVDSPILERSRQEKSLKWIVLDEAHTYIGSQAAELSLLLRRVIEAFGVEADSVRFVATSATLAGDKAKQQLATYLAALAGVSEDRVTVVSGERDVPDVSRPEVPTTLGIDEIRAIDVDSIESEARHSALCQSAVASSLRVALTSSGKPPNLTELTKVAAEALPGNHRQDATTEQTLAWLDTMTGTVNPLTGHPFVKLRIHMFQRMLHGLWSCVNPECDHKSEALDQWPFGQVHVTQRAKCTCGDPVFEVGFCDACKQPHLITEEVDGFLYQPSSYVNDEFSLLSDELDEHDDEEQSDSAAEFDSSRESERGLRTLAANSTSNVYQSVSLDLASGELGLVSPQRGISVNLGDGHEVHCSACDFAGYGRGDVLRKSYLGAPFYVSNAVPTVLEFCPDALSSDSSGRAANELPANGRKLITFTDSRQGTARMAVRMQQEAERSRLRGLVFSVLRDNTAAEALSLPGAGDETAESLLARAAKLRSIGEEVLAAQKEAEAARLADDGFITTHGPEISWDEMAENLASDNDIQGSVLSYNKYAHPELFQGHGRSAGSIARLLLAREYARRPKRANSTESLGLVRVGYRGLESVSKVPEFWSETKAIHGLSEQRTQLTIDDWKNFLKVALDFYVRENTFLRLTNTQQRWMGSRFARKELLSPDSKQEQGPRTKRWPLASTKSRSRLVKILASGTELDINDAIVTDKMDTWLRVAWSTLCDKSILTERGGGWALDLSSLRFSLPATGWVCPVTNRILDTTFLGVTPYQPRNVGVSIDRCRPINLPQLTSLRPAGSDIDSKQSIRRKVSADADIFELRTGGIWSDISDRVVEGGFYYRTAEHSAQQSQKRLKEYENMFKKGTVNVLNCSTTMEMGVDIGGVSAVVMNNVPPHPANYLQRAGRAGRRSETRSVAYTLCRNQPHDRRAYDKPEWPFVTPIQSPNITLESRPLVRRHVHSFLLSRFLRSFDDGSTDRTRLTVQWFFGSDSPLALEFIGWLLSSEGDLDQPLRSLVRGTALAVESYRGLTAPAIKQIEKFHERWVDEEQRLVILEERNRDEPYGRALAKELERHQNEYLLRDLTVRGFLPGYGFPTDVVSLRTYNFEDFLNKKESKEEGREDNIFNYKEQPSRGMAVALREYAPGAQIVVDGRVYHSAGVSLHWRTPGVKSEVQAMDIAWRCDQCGTRGFLEKRYSHDSVCCTGCDRTLSRGEIDTVLQPAGFVTDFFEETTNDVTTQTYIDAQRPVISLEAEEMSLPDSRCGAMRLGNEGHVFVHSAGEYGKGYAVCLRCGRAESMPPSGEAPHGMPRDEGHKPIGGEVGSSKEKICEPEGIQYSILLGNRSRTDVLELFLRNPNTLQWLGSGADDGVVAMTIALALREAIADRLGIAGAEIGFGYRVDRDPESDMKRAIPQVYDTAVGGAGFVIAGALDPVGLLENMIQKLECRDDCENVCPSCLVVSDGRVEREQLDRLGAKQWFKDSEFLSVLRLPDVLRSIDGTSWWSYTPVRFLEEQVRESSTEIAVILNNKDCEVWSFDSPELRRRATTLKQEHDCALCLLLPQKATLDDSQREELRLLERLGVEISSYDEATSVSKDYRIRLQSISKDGTCRSLVSLSPADILSESSWLDRFDSETLAITTGIGSITRERLELKEQKSPAPNAEVIELITDLNGPVRSLPERFKKLLDTNAPVFSQLLASDAVVSMRYEDRYLGCPWNIVLLAGFLKSLAGPSLKSVKLVMGKPSNQRYFLRESHDDWQDASDMKDAVIMFLENPLGFEPGVEVVERKQISHRRTLTLDLVSGKQVVCSFDQGMGYWWMNAAGAARRFDFGASSIQQSRAMKVIYDTAVLKNCAPTPTDLSIYSASR